MLYYILYPLREYFSPLNVFQYITFRSAIAAILALIISFTLGPLIINQLQKRQIGEKIREGFKIAIVGPTNAGKSSLLNYLSRREAAIVSELSLIHI